MGVVFILCNIVWYIEMVLVDKFKVFWLFIYCWCGGMWLFFMVIVFLVVGWKVMFVYGGYCCWCDQVCEVLEVEQMYWIILIDGQIGMVKICFLYVLVECGEQVIDLEGFVYYCGLIFGDFVGEV